VTHIQQDIINIDFTTPIAVGINAVGGKSDRSREQNEESEKD
jgi:hypothetical protein